MFHSFQYNFNSVYYPQFSASLFNDTNGVPRFNLSLFLNTDFVRSSTFFDLKAKTNENSGGLGKDFLKGSVDTCKVSKGTLGNFMIQMVVKNLAKYSNYKFECIVKKGPYYARDFPITFDYIPHYFLTMGRRGFECTITVKGKPKDVNSSMVHMFSFKFYGEIF